MLAAVPASTSHGAPATLQLNLRSRVETFKGSGAWDEILIQKRIAASEAAIVICDMWDDHWCRGAAARCGELARRMAPVVKAARARGVQIIHSPSDTMDFYLQSPQRKRMILAHDPVLPQPVQLPDPPLPIDDSDGGCDTPEKPWYKAWTRQHPAIEIADSDVLSDKGSEIYQFLKERGTRYILYMGVHTNMCVLNRSFAIKQMTRLGFKCILVRDLTDTMYDPKDRPHVTHEQGTELVVQHIEKYWCPSVLSTDITSGAKYQHRPK